MAKLYIIGRLPTYLHGILLRLLHEHLPFLLIHSTIFSNNYRSTPIYSICSATPFIVHIDTPPLQPFSPQERPVETYAFTRRIDASSPLLSSKLLDSFSFDIFSPPVSPPVVDFSIFPSPDPIARAAGISSPLVPKPLSSYKERIASLKTWWQTHEWAQSKAVMAAAGFSRWQSRSQLHAMFDLLVEAIPWILYFWNVKGASSKVTFLTARLTSSGWSRVEEKSRWKEGRWS